MSTLFSNKKKDFLSALFFIAVLPQRWHFDFCVAKIGLPQKGLKKDDGVRGRREELSLYITPQLSDSSSSLWREWVFQLVGAKGEELLLDK